MKPGPEDNPIAAHLAQPVFEPRHSRWGPVFFHSENQLDSVAFELGLRGGQSVHRLPPRSPYGCMNIGAPVPSSNRAVTVLWLQGDAGQCHFPILSQAASARTRPTTGLKGVQAPWSISALPSECHSELCS